MGDRAKPVTHWPQVRADEGREAYFTFFPATTIPGLLAPELAVAGAFAFACLGFLLSLLPR